jgi:prevent-host-death family protein
MSHFVSLYDAKTQLSALVDQAAAGDEIVIAKNGVPTARLMSLPFQGQERKPAHALQVEYIAPDFDEPVPEIEGMFAGGTT